MAEEKKVEERKETALGTKVRDEAKPFKVLTYDEIQVGDKVSPMTRYITLEMGIKHGKIYGDFYSGHVDAESSKRQFGVATMPIQGAFVHGSFTPFMVNWLRSTKPWICGGKADIRFVMAVNSGMTLTYQGVVVEKKVEGDKKYVVCDVWAENERGEKCAVGQCTACFQ
jgi:acyl dehydratase